ncbi:hypothetical protein PTW35_11090 [Photobacterium sp. DA100]|uniref:hypothetical protein n=1 Tax=Photobacterium sp. DA100 TaxID=3027472 RepID=UPI0024796296|nr:hypothetical protein [Photobacterium sp. DA100]WEM41186.1 hypothetical protein PTW35_11090 [Photobacterium sp. DA100]
MARLKRMFVWLRKWYFMLSPIPIIMFISFYLYLNAIEGWGAIGIAQIMQIPVLLSVMMALVGGIMIFWANHLGERRASLVIVTLLYCAVLVVFCV